MTAAELAALVGGELHGPDRHFTGVAPLETAGPGEVAYASAERGESRAGVLLSTAPRPGQSCVVVADPKRAFITLLERMFPETHAPGVHPGAHVHPTARVHPAAVIYPGCWVGAGCVIGAETILFANVSVYPGTVIGARCRVHAGAVLGADGFSYHPGPGGPVKVPQVGRLVIEDDVEIGANAAVDRAFLEETRLGRGVKLDNLVHIGHNSEIGAGTVAAAQTGVSGSCRIGAGCQLGGQVGVADHAEIGAGARLGARAAARGRLAGGRAYLGVPAAPAQSARRAMVVAQHLPEMWHMLHRLRRTVEGIAGARDVDNHHNIGTAQSAGGGSLVD